MVMFRKVKDWIVGLFKKESVASEIPTIPIELVAPRVVEEVAPVVEAPAPVEAPTPFAAVAREQLALSPRDVCAHDFAKKQIWTRVAKKQFELQNEFTCLKCKNRKVEAIR